MGFKYGKSNPNDYPHALSPRHSGRQPVAQTEKTIIKELFAITVFQVQDNCHSPVLKQYVHTNDINKAVKEVKNRFTGTPGNSNITWAHGGGARKNEYYTQVEEIKIPLLSITF